VTQSEGS